MDGVTWDETYFVLTFLLTRIDESQTPDASRT